jgi:hypothetical protein
MFDGTRSRRESNGLWRDISHLAFSVVIRNQLILWTRTPAPTDEKLFHLAWLILIYIGVRREAKWDRLCERVDAGVTTTLLHLGESSGPTYTSCARRHATTQPAHPRARACVADSARPQAASGEPPRPPENVKNVSPPCCPRVRLPAAGKGPA